MLDLNILQFTLQAQAIGMLFFQIAFRAEDLVFERSFLMGLNFSRVSCSFSRQLFSRANFSTSSLASDLLLINQLLGPFLVHLHLFNFTQQGLIMLLPALGNGFPVFAGVNSRRVRGQSRAVFPFFLFLFGLNHRVEGNM
jgi:hypothetical protein